MICDSGVLKKLHKGENHASQIYPDYPIMEKIQNELEVNLKNNALKLDELVDKLDHNEEKTVKVIRWLLDNRKLKYDVLNRLTWVK